MISSFVYSCPIALPSENNRIMESSPHFKIVMTGNSGVGKTALVERISEDVFADAHVPTVGAQFIAIELSVNGNQCTLELWDTAGQEVFRSLVGFYAREAKGAFVLFDLTDKASFLDLTRWLEFVHENAPQAKIIVFGNKSDLAESREVSPEDVDAFITSKGLTYFEGSAKTAQNVKDAFEKMAEMVFEKTDRKADKSVNIKEGDGNKKKKGCCGGGGSSKKSSD